MSKLTNEFMDYNFYVFDANNRLVSFAGRTYDEAIDYYINHRGAMYSKLYLDVMRKSLLNENFSTSQVDLFIKAIKQGYDYRWLVIDKFNNKGFCYYMNNEKLLFLYNHMDCLHGESIGNYPREFVEIIQTALLDGDRRVIDIYVSFNKLGKNSSNYIKFLDIIRNSYKFVVFMKDANILQVSEKYGYSNVEININTLTDDFVHKVVSESRGLMDFEFLSLLKSNNTMI